MTKLIYLIIILFSFPTHLKAQDITQFDFPFLLGDWFWFSPNQNEPGDEKTYRAISIRFTSDYHFLLKILDSNGHVEEAKGSFDLNETMLVLHDEDTEPQYHDYSLNHNQLMLKDTKFTKMLPQDLSGAWYSNYISGNDVDEQVDEMILMLRPDFLFLMRVLGKEGQSVTHRGVYILEDNHLVLIYRDGQQDALFHLEENELTLSNTQFDMEAVLTRHMP